MERNTQMKIERAHEEDSEIIIEMLTKLYLELGEESESLGFLTKNFIRQIIQSKKTIIYIIKLNSNCIGIFTLTESQAVYAGGKFGVIDEMYISPEHRQKKYGENVIRFIRQIGKEKQWPRIDVTAPTEERWIRTRKFYEKNGFVFAGPKYKLKP